MAEEKKQELRQLTLVETFYLYLWTLYKGGAITEIQTFDVLMFCKKLGPNETVDYCFAELEKIREKYAPKPVDPVGTEPTEATQ